MKISKKIIIPAVSILALGGALAFGLSSVSASSDGTASHHVCTKKAGAGAKTTNFEQTRLDKLAKAAKITSAQEQSILAELQAVQTKYAALITKGMSSADRKTQMQNKINELKTWAQAQGIDSAYVVGNHTAHPKTTKK